MLPALAPFFKGTGGAGALELLTPLAITMGKVVAFVALMLIVGRRVIPWILHSVAHTGSRELFRLAVLAIALGVAFAAATLFGVSFALGAFFAGMVMSESELSQRAASETLPLRDAFAVLFFVSVGMLFDPAILVNDFLPVLVAVLIIVFGKSIAAFVIVRAFRHDTPTALTISASLAQIGEFSFILAGLGVSLELLPERGRNLILAGAIVSILLNPLIFALLDRYLAKQVAASAPAKPQPTAAREPVPPTTLERPHRIDRPWAGGRLHHRRSQERPALPGHRGQSRPHPGAERAGPRGHPGQCRRSGSAGGRQSSRRTLPAGRHSGCLRGRAGHPAGEGAQCQPADHRPRPFRGRDRAPDEARCDRCGDGRARNRQGDARLHPGAETKPATA